MAQDWFRFHALALHNPRVRKLPDDLFRIWVNAMCIVVLEGDTKDGRLPPIEDCADLLRMPVNNVVEKFNLLVEKGLMVKHSMKQNETKGRVSSPKNETFIETIEETFHVSKWKDKQYISDTSTDRVRKHRNAKRNGHGNAPRTEQNRAEQNRSHAADLSNDMKSELKPPDHYNIEIFLKDEDRAAFREVCPGVDLKFMTEKFNRFIVEVAKERPDYPGKAFVAWSKSINEKEKGKK